MSARPFTGRTMWRVMIGFFGTIILVNTAMAWLASASFGGTVVDNSYVASQKFNGWLAAARRQQALGWTASLSLDATRHPVVRVEGGAVAASGVAEHPLGRAPDMPLSFSASGPGRLVAAQVLPPGRWLVRVKVERGGEVVRLAAPLT